MSETRKLRVAIDYDDVVVNFMSAYIIHYNRVNNTNFTLGDVTRDYTFPGQSSEDRDASLKAFYKTLDFLRLMPSLQSIMGMSSLTRQGHSLYILSDRSHQFREQITSTMVGQLNGTFSEENIFVTNYYSSGQKTTKAEFCHDKKIDVLIDDSLRNVLECSGNGTKAVLFDRPWNSRRTEKVKGVYRVYDDWKSIRERKLTELLEGI